MSSGHNHHDNHSSEPKTVSFRTPMILGFVTLLAIVLLVSTCDKKECCKEGEKCEESANQKSHGAHEQEDKKEHTQKQEGATILNSAEENPQTDSLAATQNAVDTTAKERGHTAH